MSLAWVAVALAALGLVQGKPASARRLLLGALLVALASASLRLVAGTDHLSPAMNISFDGNGIVFLQVVVGFLLLGLGLGWATGAWLPMLAVTIVTGFSARVLLGFAGWVRPVGFAAAVLAVSALGWLAIVALRPGRLLVGLDRGLLDPGSNAAWRPQAGWTPTSPVIAAAAAVGTSFVVPHLSTVLGGSVLALVAAWVAARGSRRGAWLLLPAAVVVALVLLWSVRLSGPLGGWIPTLIDGPFSPRAAQAMALMVAAAGAVAAGAWPLHGAAVPVLLAPVAVTLSAVFAAFLIPDGVQWWQPIFAPLALIGIAHAIANRRADHALVAAGVYGLWTGTRAGALGGALLIGSGWVAAVAPSTWIGRLPLPPLLSRLLLLVPATGVLLVQRGGIATETSYAMGFTAAVAVGVAVFGARERIGSVAPSRQHGHI